jgi:hypothetical protein
VSFVIEFVYLSLNAEHNGTKKHLKNGSDSLQLEINLPTYMSTGRLKGYPPPEQNLKKGTAHLINFASTAG